MLQFVYNSAIDTVVGKGYIDYKSSTTRVVDTYKIFGALFYSSSNTVTAQAKCS